MAAKFVLVTGASSGIGRATALRLAADGFTVFAGVRKAEDEASLRQAGPRLQPIRLDVTDSEAIGNAVSTVAATVGGAGLYGLVNNAGFGNPGPMEYVPLADVKRQFEVNVFGALAVTQAFLPLIRIAQGRIVNMGSVGDRITIPFGGVLCGCKSALASLTEALRLELHPWGIHVCLIEPASIATPAADKTVTEGRKLLASLNEEASRRYGQMFDEFLDRTLRFEKRGSSPDVVAHVIFRALVATRPKPRYPVGRGAKLLTSIATMPDRMLDALRLRLFHLPVRFGALRERTLHR